MLDWSTGGSEGVSDSDYMGAWPRVMTHFHWHGTIIIFIRQDYMKKERKLQI
jgi:hypothetical protein